MSAPFISRAVSGAPRGPAWAPVVPKSHTLAHFVYTRLINSDEISFIHMQIWRIEPAGAAVARRRRAVSSGAPLLATV